MTRERQALYLIQTYLPTVITNDLAEALEVIRKALLSYSIQSVRLQCGHILEIPERCIDCQITLDMGTLGK